ncbi:histidine--tRNA ligase [Bacillus pseudomycoides]|uniref:Histidine--tRNA ligase n=1 Tax=Bacillus pseudomycoides TaxID=64104 RepID=A0AA91VAQ9_9BACI|nr:MULTISPECIES: histidine--tRNA ligase [Bacillus]PEB53018.1 histidine--tRNA ligase [Bacillus sp. AFS098217]PED81796.1 histidine--tRNA ligase [Bacillus pseudomycoides]PEU15224.1 histidine--tRNA ligase [Bacillus sp. AFS014408]PEU17826.1 histidine--tRNA ligase [Bacillus sp. AFS019443]PFW63067.1 histidine--tRNA ligase [Bacillus sp. AFS075034]
MDIRNVKGTKDYLPSEQILRNTIKRACEETFERYGCKPLETPTLNMYELMAYKYGGGSEILKEMYTLRDQGNRELALRYDLTIPFAKVVAMNPDIRLPFKRYEIGKVFRDGPIKQGRFREFIQCDVDIVGVESVIAEAELMGMAFDLFQTLNLDVTIQYNNRKLLTGILKSIEIPDTLTNDVILSLDKIEKIGIDGIRKDLQSRGIVKEMIEIICNTIKSCLTLDLNEFKETFSNSLVTEGINELEQLQQYLLALGIKNNTSFNPFLARGLTMYTGTIYEIFLTDGSISSSIGSGGRYDNIIGAFRNDNTPYPTVGISFGLDVIYTALVQKETNSNSADIFIIPIGTETKCLQIAQQLRSNHTLKIELELAGRKLKRALNYANKEKIPYVLIIGETEISTETIVLRDMKEGVEKKIPLSCIENGTLRDYL